MAASLGMKTEQEMQQQQVMQPSRVPTDKVMEMRKQGLSNNQIIQVLQRDGYELTAIFNALNQADLKGDVDAGAVTAGFVPEQEQFTQHVEQIPMMQDTGMMQDIGAPGVQPEDMVQQPIDIGQQMPPLGYQQAPSFRGYMPQGPSFEAQRIEELAEAIIDEKWNEIVRSINKIIDWKERVESRLTKVEQQLDDINKNVDTLYKGVLGKLSDYDRNLTNVGAEIKAMDKVFQKVLPSLTESVSELSRISNTMKKK